MTPSIDCLNAGGESREEFGMRRRIEASLKTGKARSRTGDPLKLNPVECVSGDEEVPRFEGRRSIRQKKDSAFWGLEDEVRFWEPPPGIEDPGSQRELEPSGQMLCRGGQVGVPVQASRVGSGEKRRFFPQGFRVRILVEFVEEVRQFMPEGSVVRRPYGHLKQAFGARKNHEAGGSRLATNSLRKKPVRSGKGRSGKCRCNTLSNAALSLMPR